LHGSAPLSLHAGVLNRLVATADVRMAMRVHSDLLAAKARVARRSLLNGPAALVFAASLLLVVDAGSSRVRVVVVPIDLAVKTRIARHVVARFAKPPRVWGGHSQHRAVIVGVSVFRVSETGLAATARDLKAFHGWVGNPIADSLKSLITRVGAVSTALALASAVVGLPNAFSAPVRSVIGLFTPESGITFVLLGNAGSTRLAEFALPLQDGAQ